MASAKEYCENAVKKLFSTKLPQPQFSYTFNKIIHVGILVYKSSNQLASSIRTIDAIDRYEVKLNLAASIVSIYEENVSFLSKKFC